MKVLLCSPDPRDSCYPIGVNMRFVLGPAGSGKTFHCLAGVRARLAASPSGPPLILLAPKQATFQLERQLLSDPAVSGYVRLHVLSFERLADWVLAALHEPVRQPLSEEGRVMVLRALLMRHQGSLELFGSTARQPGFALELSQLLKEFNHYGHSPEGLAEAAHRWPANHVLGRKLRDISKVGLAFREWMKITELQDADALPGLAAAALKQWLRTAPVDAVGSQYLIDGLWMDGFSELTPQELELLSALAPACRDMTLAFCIENKTVDELSWLSSWSHPVHAFRKCYAHLSATANAAPQIEIIERGQCPGRFDNQPTLARLEMEWTKAQPNTTAAPPVDPSAIRMVACANPAAETIMAAREIRRFVREGHRYRDCAVLLRSFDGYKDLLRRVFERYEIPCFLDRRESVAHHPLAELTRNALRTVAFNWMPKDWFGALKTGLAGATENEIDWIENLALARGWQGDQWQQPIATTDPEESERLEELRVRLMAPFTTLTRALGARPTGSQLATALRDFWQQIDAGAALERWSRDASSVSSAVHATIWREMHNWLENLEQGFDETALPLRDWLPIIEAGLSGLTVGVVPPALDQVLIGTVDRSRNPDLHLAIVLGLNETVFPAVPTSSGLLSETDRDLLAEHGIALGSNQRALMARERYLGYIALTRARQRLVLSSSLRDAQEKPLNPSPFLSRIRRIFPDLKPEDFSTTVELANAAHPCELIPPLLRDMSAEYAAHDSVRAGNDNPIPRDIPMLEPLLQRLRPLAEYREESVLSSEQAGRIYGATLRTSISQLESFAMCPFRFFVSAGMRGREREYFELAAREQGNFQHEVLAQFHQTLKTRHQRWRDIQPQEGRALIGEIGVKVIAEVQFGLLQSSPAATFRAHTLLAALQDFIEVALDWMSTYQFDPIVVELSFGGREPNLPAWRLALDATRAVELDGRIDRVDLWKSPGNGPAWFAVMDYKSSDKKIDAVLLKNGIQIQLPAYLVAIQNTALPALAQRGVTELIPAGAFYINLRGKYESAKNREEASLPPLAQHREAAQHRGLFDLSALELLDTNAKTENPSGQFKAKFTQEGKPWSNQCDGQQSVEFRQSLDQITQLIKDFGLRILNGDATVAPYRKGNKTACDFCDTKDICRTDPWTRQYRLIS